MAKKIKIVKNSITSNKIIKKDKKFDFFRVSTPILIVLLIISIFMGVDTYNEKIEISNELVKAKENYHITTEKLLSITDGRSVRDITAKLDFIDRYVAIVIKEYGNYYYNYECYQKLTGGPIINLWNDETQQYEKVVWNSETQKYEKVGNRDYSFWIYNIEAAKLRGYKEGTC